MGFLGNPFKKLKKVAKLGKKLDPIGSKIAGKISPAAKFLMKDKKKRLYEDTAAMDRAASVRANNEGMEGGGPPPRMRAAPGEGTGKGMEDTRRMRN